MRKPPVSCRWMAVFFIMLGCFAGCGNSAQEIPLAKVPPPPPGFGEPKKSPSTPTGGSPENAGELSR